MYTLCDIRGLDRAEVLAALFNASRQQGMGLLDPSGVGMMDVVDARAEIERREAYWRERGGIQLKRKEVYFDYLRGRVLKVDLTSEDYFDPRLYDRDNGHGAAFNVVAKLYELKAERDEAAHREWMRKNGGNAR